ncbi:GntR family transcriptional regulator [Levilactobacillus bambusae]|uniref:GntR family transcriptional regulator n=1 Tax=Levilactobacillus bambusae TaxID=2024736 RepID=A0A2V1MYS5_9LACO|nr:GntR family transcriptional regulator [Levilactobacillus bambusae]PWG00161.1 GntR family transcriptional regulator [Levilactobacillus bambusae]
MTTKYETIKKGLKEDILAGKYSINQKLPTETELMNQYKVSRYTVRRAVGDLENEHFIYRIQGGGMFVDDWEHQEAAQSTDNKMVGILSTHVANYIFPNIISGADRVLSDNGYMMTLSNTHNDPERERRSLLALLDNRVSGLIVEPTQSALASNNLDLYHKIYEIGLPTVFINAIYPQLEGMFPTVTVDDALGVAKLTNYLIDNGHERILGVFQVDDLQGVHRMEGFLNTYRQHPQISLNAEAIMYQSSDDLSQVLNKIETRLGSDQKPTAIICYNDQLALQVIDLIRSLDLSVPKDVSVAGFDNYQLGQYMDPRLTTLMHEKEKMGHDAADLLMKEIKHEKVASIQYDPQLIVRGSTRKV